MMGDPHEWDECPQKKICPVPWRSRAQQGVSPQPEAIKVKEKGEGRLQQPSFLPRGLRAHCLLRPYPPHSPLLPGVSSSRKALKSSLAMTPPKLS